jgi:hypothetical protein
VTSYLFKYAEYLGLGLGVEIVGYALALAFQGALGLRQ